MKKRIAMIISVAMISAMMTACGGNDSAEGDTADTTTSAAENTEAVDETTAEATETEAEETTVEAVVLPEGTIAEDGDAYLAYGDAQWWLQYGGNDMEPLSYGATVAHIDGDGTYTVSLDASNEDAVGMNGLDVINGCAFTGIVIKNGEELFPDQAVSINIDKVVIDGTEVELTAKNYTNYEDGNLRANIFNSYVTEAPTEDVWTADGSLDGISAQIVPASTFDSFSTIEVTFTISGAGEGSGDADSDAEGDTEETSADGATETTAADDQAEATEAAE